MRTVKAALIAVVTVIAVNGLAGTPGTAVAADTATVAAPRQPTDPPTVPGYLTAPGSRSVSSLADARTSMVDPGDWLSEINLYRTAAGLPPVVEEPTWTAGLLAHFNYLTHTPAIYFVEPYASVHTENPASPYYTPAGDQAARASNLAWGFTGSPVGQIDGWLLAPFHAVGILRPGLERVAFARDPFSSWSGLNVISGLNWPGPTATPLLFPGPGVSTNLTGWLVNEVPDPLETCGWQNQFPGPGLIAMLPSDPAVGLTATLVADSGPDFSTAVGNLCVVDMHTYFSTDPVYGPTGLSLLTGGDHPVFLIPSAPLTWSRYRATIKQPGKPDVAWSFVATPPRQPLGLESVVLHVTDTGAETVIGNLTVTEPWAGAGFTTVYPCLEGRPLASNNNYTIGLTIPNLVVAHPDANGDICLFTSASAHLIWDQVAETDAFPTHIANRLVDTRLTGMLPAGGVQVVHVTGTGAETVIGNLTVTEPTGAGFTTVYPCLQGRPTASNNNYTTGQTIPNLVVAHPDSNGNICLYTSTSTHLIWDQVAETNAFPTHVASRLVDTRLSGKLPDGGVQVVHVSTGARTVIGNLTVTEPTGSGFTTVYACLEGRPLASNNNFTGGQTIPNLVVARSDSNGNLCLYTSTSAHLIWDQVAETNAFTTHLAERLIDTRFPAGRL